MSRHSKVYQSLSKHQRRLRTDLPCLSQPQASELGLWTAGLIVSSSCSLHRVAQTMSALLKKPFNTLRQRLRDWYLDAEHKSGPQRAEVVVERCFSFLLAWVVRCSDAKHLTLVLDATTLQDRFTVLSISVVFRSCAVPVAWTVLPANQVGAWRPHWLRLLRQLRFGVPKDSEVMVMADRGLYASWLFRRIVRLGWHPFLRINSRASFRPVGETQFVPLLQLVERLDGHGCLCGTAFSTSGRRLDCTLAVYQKSGCATPWLILTDYDPCACDARWYRMRGWIEQGFKHLKRGGWQWQGTRMTDCRRVERTWLVLAVATLWSVLIGAQQEDKTNALLLPDRRLQRQVSIFRRGLSTLQSSLIQNGKFPLLGTFTEPRRKSALLGSPAHVALLDSS